MKHLGVGILAIVLAINVPGFSGSSPSTATTREAPTPKVELGPMGALHVYNDTMLRGDKSQLKPRTHATTEAGRKLQEACTANDAAVGKILKQAKKKLDDKSAHEIGQMLGDTGNEELSEAHETIDGDHAEVSTPGSSSKTQMIRIDGLWRLDYDKVAENFSEKGELDRVLEIHQMHLQAAEALDKALSNDEVKSVDDAVKVLQMAYRRQMIEQNQ